jgi:hypothetical protein
MLLFSIKLLASPLKLMGIEGDKQMELQSSCEATNPAHEG